MCAAAASSPSSKITAEDRNIKSITVFVSIQPGSSQKIVAYDINQRGCLQQFIGSTVELMQIQCRMCPEDAASAEELMTDEARHIKSITVRMSANCGSSQSIVAYDIREDVCNDS